MRWPDRLAGMIGGLLLLAVLVPMGLMLWSLLEQGAGVLSMDFLLEDPRQAGRAGGIAALLVSTGWILAVCLLVAVPVGLGCALYLSEQVPAGTRRAQWLGGVLDMLAAVPSIVYGLFGYQFFAISLGLGFSILSGGLALALMVLPLMIRSAEQALRGVPMSYRQASEALSISRWGWVRRILVPQAAPGIAVGIILSIGRALAETAVLLFTAGYVLRQPDSLLDSGRALSVHIYDLAMNVPGGMPRAAATGLVLVAILVILNLLVRRWLRPAQGAWQ
ncbi:MULTISPECIES: phosphate ABC transporter permease PstA [unclassified Alcanivorax]|jgi:phosphate transport system permease protein|uniref:phosphate ABC transporter permease PstA n=2 Tax=Alcanivorax TaxID=59753 RepID=UPI000789D2DA|nr:MULTISPECIES: phosphate ABC transporter permease PstA [unclassified Alcanivorax]KZX74162.1 phosphate ABC transporter, permease protein PstA [Alcanivorax sp. HI0011]KZX75537.1 phosphate ABC transporter, permease protein PstA [Alcanivorax sp. HI0013]KZY11695.1 phosphate ABC transporter, permease protein PstA [Alcanivorax sp. HI0035]MEE2604255.1 phosphate ABC transporter permease PstA [Pseudomonadota bacterium]KZX66872.1 phosphate ABC transporter, permease protein PstA [Alcanivorax sp. HI0007]